MQPITLQERPQGARTEPEVFLKMLPSRVLGLPLPPGAQSPWLRQCKLSAPTAASSSGGLAGQPALLLIPEMLAQHPGDWQ